MQADPPSPESAHTATQALSPNSVEGEHDHVTGQTRPAAAVDAVHRIVTDATRLTSSWVEGLEQQGMPDTHYVELLSIVVAVRSIDVFHLAMGLDAESLPAPLPGAPRERRPPVSNFARVRRVSYF